MDITQTNLRYLLAVYELMGSNAGVAAVEVSRRMGVSKPSVTRMLGVLAKRGLLVKEPYGKVRLTERGALLAQEYAVCVDMVQRRLPRLEFSLTDSETAELACVLVPPLPPLASTLLCAWKKKGSSPKGIVAVGGRALLQDQAFFQTPPQLQHVLPNLLDHILIGRISTASRVLQSPILPQTAGQGGARHAAAHGNEDIHRFQRLQ